MQHQVLDHWRERAARFINRTTQAVRDQFQTLRELPGKPHDLRRGILWIMVVILAVLFGTSKSKR